jgi:hypothetical protein
MSNIRTRMEHRSQSIPQKVSCLIINIFIILMLGPPYFILFPEMAG